MIAVNDIYNEESGYKRRLYALIRHWQSSAGNIGENAKTAEIALNRENDRARLQGTFRLQGTAKFCETARNRLQGHFLIFGVG